MKYSLKDPTYQHKAGCGGPAHCATQEIINNSRIQNKIANMNGGAVETGPVVPSVVGASNEQNNFFNKMAKLSVINQEHSRFDNDTGKPPITGGKRITKKSKKRGGRKSRSKSLSQPRSHAQFMGTNLDYAGHFPAKQGGKTSRRTRKKGGDKKRGPLEDKLLAQQKRQKMGLPDDEHDKRRREWEAEKDKQNLENINPDTYLAPSGTPGDKAPSQRADDANFGPYSEDQNYFQEMMKEKGHYHDGDAASMEVDPNTPSFGGKKRRTRKRHGKGPLLSKELPEAKEEGKPVTNVYRVPGPEDPLHGLHKKFTKQHPTAEAEYALPPQFATPVSDNSFHSRHRTRVINGTRLVPPPGPLRNPRKNLGVGGKKKTKKFKKHYMWNTKGKRYMAKTYKQHLRGVKLGHTHKKPKKSKRRTKKRGGDPNFKINNDERIAKLNENELKELQQARTLVNTPPPRPPRPATTQPYYEARRRPGGLNIGLGWGLEESDSD
uniref:Uncharacterized protein n=1 Tax=viral metagenome TaxID=1070528 RepID=A0A6C0BS96_9ZZZZ